MRTKLSRTLAIFLGGFIFSVLIFAGSIYYTYRAEETLYSDFEDVEETHEIINDLKRISNLLVNLEKDIKVYSITLNSDFKGSFNTQSELVLYEIKKVHNTIIGEDSAKVKIEKLVKLVRNRIRFSKQQIKYITNRVKNIRTEQKYNEIESNFKIAIEKLINQLITHEQLTLHRQQENVVNKLSETHLTIKIVGLSAFILSLLIVLFFYQYNKTHNRIEHDLIELNDNKNKFFSIISHDLRGPVKNIVLMAQLLHGNYSSKSIDPTKIAKMIESSANNTSELLDNLLKWSRLQMNKIDFIPESLDLKKLTDDAINNLIVHADQKSITMVNNIIEHTLIKADQNMIATVIRNLISNSLKFTNKGGKIEISAKPEGSFIEIVVADNGVGMPGDVALKIFAIDFKHSTKGTNKEEGTGLGLKLCKEFVEKNGGKIRIESKLNEGSKFIFTIPAA